MAYRLDLEEEPSASLRRAAREQLEKGADGLGERHADDPVATVHDARKRLKKSRSALRLVRPAMPRGDYRRENRLLRDRGRAMSGTRDADVMVETVDKLSDRFAGQEPAALFDSVRERLAERAEAARADPGDVGRHASELRELVGRVEGWPAQDLSFDTFARALARTYKRGRKAFRRVEEDPTDEALHEWRKRVKDLWYQLRLLGVVWPGLMKAHAREAKQLSRLLGDDHDLAVLTQRLATDPDLTAAPAADRERLGELIAHRRAELLEQARALGPRLYAESPKAFGRRIRRYASLAAAEADADAEAA
jgi:CHAD domain-containing protein